MLDRARKIAEGMTPGVRFLDSCGISVGDEPYLMALEAGTDADARATALHSREVMLAAWRYIASTCADRKADLAGDSVETLEALATLDAALATQLAAIENADA